MRLSWKILFFIDALAHSPISAHSLISDSKRHHNSLLNFCFFIHALAHSPISAHSLISDSKRHHNSLLNFCFFIHALAHSPISAHSLISDSKREFNSQLKIFFYRRLSPLAHLGPFSYFGFKTPSQLSVEIVFLIDAIANSPISAHSLISLMTEKWWEKTFQEVERSKFRKPEKMMRKDVSGGQRSKFKK
jgi:hypothetical protein